jgi:hypothetical protein
MPARRARRSAETARGFPVDRGGAVRILPMLFPVRSIREWWSASQGARGCISSPRTITQGRTGAEPEVSEADMKKKKGSDDEFESTPNDEFEEEEDDEDDDEYFDDDDLEEDEDFDDDDDGDFEEEFEDAGYQEEDGEFEGLDDEKDER